MSFEMAPNISEFNFEQILGFIHTSVLQEFVKIARQ